jgi:hypothetical protein
MASATRCEWDAEDLTGYAERWLADLRFAHGDRDARDACAAWLADRIAETRSGLPVANAAYDRRTGKPEPLHKHEQALAEAEPYARRAVLFLAHRHRAEAVAAVRGGLDRVAALAALDRPTSGPSAPRMA